MALRLPGRSTAWKNWAGNQSFDPQHFERPLTEKQVQQIVVDAAAQNRRVRAVGSGHSFTAIAGSHEVMVSLEHMNLVRSVDFENNTVTVDAGIQLSRLNDYLATVGLAMTNLGDIAYQSVAGAVSTGTHGTGLAFGGIATQLRSLRVVTADGEAIDCSPNENAALFHAARVGLGALGIMTQATIAVEPAFNLHAIEEPSPIVDVLGGWSDHVRKHDHFEFFWIPGTDKAMTKSNRRTDEPAQPLSKLAFVRDKVLGENLGFGALTKLGKYRPELSPKLAAFAASAAGRAEYIENSHRVFATPRWVKFVEMEYSVPLDSVPEVVDRITNAVAQAGIELVFPIEVRCSAADDIPLSTSTGRDSGYVAVHRTKGRPYREYFELVEAIVDDYDGRPHWGKLHFQTAGTLARRYPEWDAFQRVRADVDPHGLFGNDYTDRVLGPVAS